MSDTFCHVKNRPCYRDDCEPGKFCAMYDKPVTDTPADPIAAEAREIAARVLIEHFDAELNRSPADPIGARTRLTDRMAAAFGHRMKAAGRAEASAVWRSMLDSALSS